MQSTMMSGYNNPDYSRPKILCISCLQLQARDLHEQEQQEQQERDVYFDPKTITLNNSK